MSTPDVFSAYTVKEVVELLHIPRSTIYDLIQRSFKMPVQEMQGEDRKEGWEVLHTNNILLVDAEGRVVDKFNGTSDTDMVKLRQSLKELAGGEAEPSDVQTEQPGES